MTSICNYSHPELQLSAGLERQPAGTLFPYNPEFYERASGLYGPGSILTWYFLVASVILNWSFAAKDDQGYPRPGMSTDLLAMVAYAVFAATDLFVQAVKFVGIEHRALAIFCLRNPDVDLRGLGEFSHTQLSLAEIPPGIVDLGQRAVEITGPLAVCYVFVDISIALIILLVLPLFSNRVARRPTRAAKRLFLGGYAYVSLVLVVFHFSLGNIGISFFIALYEAVMPVAITLTFSWSMLVGFGIAVGLGQLFLGLVRRDQHLLLEASKVVGSSLLVGVAPAFSILGMVIGSKLLFFPDLAVTIDERDQLAALTAGISTLIYTIYRVIRQRVAHDEMIEARHDVEGTQGLLMGEMVAAEQAVADPEHRAESQEGRGSEM
ncbi:hypothetical protein VTG60DRAFT_6203 [Thermothelomyces hinnuleus]